MVVTSKKLRPQKSRVKASTPSLELAAGPSLFDWLDGPTTDQSGQEAALASHFPQPANEKAKPTSDTSGPCSSGSLTSAALQSALESRLRAKMGCAGSMEYVLTWKERVTPSGHRICALRARGRKPKDGLCVAIRPIGSGSSSALPTSGNGCSGWRSPNTVDAAGGNRNGDGQTQLCHQVLTGWVSPTAQDHNRGGLPPRASDTGIPLTQQAAMVELSGFATPSARDWRDGRASQDTMDRNSRPLNEQVTMLAGWVSPKHKDDHEYSANANTNSASGHGLTAQALGTTSESSHAPMARRGVLNPAFPRWLMAYPQSEATPGWDSCSPNWSSWDLVQKMLVELSARPEATV